MSLHRACCCEPQTCDLEDLPDSVTLTWSGRSVCTGCGRGSNFEYRTGTNWTSTPSGINGSYALTRDDASYVDHSGEFATCTYKASPSCFSEYVEHHWKSLADADCSDGVTGTSSCSDLEVSVELRCTPVEGGGRTLEWYSPQFKVTSSVTGTIAPGGVITTPTGYTATAGYYANGATTAAGPTAPSPACAATDGSSWHGGVLDIYGGSVKVEW